MISLWDFAEIVSPTLDCSNAEIGLVGYGKEILHIVISHNEIVEVLVKSCDRRIQISNHKTYPTKSIERAKKFATEVSESVKHAYWREVKKFLDTHSKEEIRTGCSPFNLTDAQKIALDFFLDKPKKTDARNVPVIIVTASPMLDAFDVGYKAAISDSRSVEQTDMIDIYGNKCNSEDLADAFPNVQMPAGFNAQKMPYTSQGQLYSRDAFTPSMARYGRFSDAFAVSPERRLQNAKVYRALADYPNVYWGQEPDGTIIIAYPFAKNKPDRDVADMASAIFGYDEKTVDDKISQSINRENIEAIIKKNGNIGEVVIIAYFAGQSIRQIFGERLSVSHLNDLTKQWLRLAVSPFRIEDANRSFHSVKNMMFAAKRIYKKDGNESLKNFIIKASDVLDLYFDRASPSQLRRISSFLLHISHSAMVHFAGQRVARWTGGIVLPRDMDTVIAMQNVVCYKLKQETLMEGRAHDIGRIVGLMDYIYAQYFLDLHKKRNSPKDKIDSLHSRLSGNKMLTYICSNPLGLERLRAIYGHQLNWANHHYSTSDSGDAETKTLDHRRFASSAHSQMEKLMEKHGSSLTAKPLSNEERMQAWAGYLNCYHSKSKRESQNKSSEELATA